MTITIKDISNSETHFSKAHLLINFLMFLDNPITLNAYCIKKYVLPGCLIFFIGCGLIIHGNRESTYSASSIANYYNRLKEVHFWAKEEGETDKDISVRVTQSKNAKYTLPDTQLTTNKHDVSKTEEAYMNGYIRSIVGPFNHEFYRLAVLIVDRNAHMAFARYGDGEASIIRGNGFLSGGVRTNQWRVRGGNTTTRFELIKSLKGHYGQPYFYGFRGSHYLSSCLKETEQNLNYITYTNVFMFNNAQKALKLVNLVIQGLAGDVVLFANKYGARNAKKFKTLKQFYGYEQDSMKVFETDHMRMKAEWREIANSHNNTLFVFSIGPLSCIAISYMWEVNPRNRYVDFGSRIDIVLKGFVTRSGYKPIRAQDNDGVWYLDAKGKPRIIRNFLQTDTRFGQRINRDDKDTFW